MKLFDQTNHPDPAEKLSPLVRRSEIPRDHTAPRRKPIQATLWGVEAKEVRGNSTGRGLAETGPFEVASSEFNGVVATVGDGRGRKGDSGGGIVEEPDVEEEVIVDSSSWC